MEYKIVPLSAQLPREDSTKAVAEQMQAIIASAGQIDHFPPIFLTGNSRRILTILNIYKQAQYNKSNYN